MKSSHIRLALERNAPLIRDAIKDAETTRQMIENALDNPECIDQNEQLRLLRQLLATHPTAWNLSRDLTASSLRILLTYLTGNDEKLMSRILGGLDGLRASLEYESSHPLERLLIDQVALCWLSYEVTKTLAMFLAYRADTEPYWEQRLARVEKRYQRAIESLARTRKLVRSTKEVQRRYDQTAPSS